MWKITFFRSESGSGFQELGGTSGTQNSHEYPPPLTSLPGILPTLFRAALILLRSKQSKYKPWNVYSPEQNGVFCDCFANFKLAKTLMSKLKCSAFIRNTSFTEELKTGKRRLKNWVFVSSVRVRVPSGYWATYCSPRAICIQGCSQVTQAPRLCHLSYIVYTIGNILLHSIYYVGKMKRTIFFETFCAY